jgi:hypothetical protein
VLEQRSKRTRRLLATSSNELTGSRICRHVELTGVLLQGTYAISKNGNASRVDIPIVLISCTCISLS